MNGRYDRPQPWNWFAKKPAYVLFMVRELTAVFIGGYLVFLIVLLSKLAGGKQEFASLIQALDSPVSQVLHLCVLVAALWHSVTWFNLTPRALPIFIGEKRVADTLVAVVMGYLPWLVVSMIILWAISEDWIASVPN